jgi:hypothetical protein
MGGYKVNFNRTCPYATMSRWCESLCGVLDRGVGGAVVG